MEVEEGPGAVREIRHVTNLASPGRAAQPSAAARSRRGHRTGAGAKPFLGMAPHWSVPGASARMRHQRVSGR